MLVCGCYILYFILEPWFVVLYFILKRHFVVTDPSQQLLNLNHRLRPRYKIIKVQLKIKKNERHPAAHTLLLLLIKVRLS